MHARLFVPALCLFVAVPSVSQQSDTLRSGPVIRPIGHIGVLLDRQFEQRVEVTPSGDDEPVVTLRFGEYTPPGYSFDEPTRTFRWTPSRANTTIGRRYDITFIAHDAGGRAEETMTLIVQSDLANPRFLRDTVRVPAVAGHRGVFDPRPYVSNPSNLGLQFSIEGAHPQMEFDTRTGEIAWLPPSIIAPGQPLTVTTLIHFQPGYGEGKPLVAVFQVAYQDLPSAVADRRAAYADTRRIINLRIDELGEVARTAGDRATSANKLKSSLGLASGLAGLLTGGTALLEGRASNWVSFGIGAVAGALGITSNQINAEDAQKRASAARLARARLQSLLQAEMPAVLPDHEFAIQPYTSRMVRIDGALAQISQELATAGIDLRN